jgi:hypothetical protein
MTDRREVEKEGYKQRRPTMREIARQEFWIVAKSFFAPVYGTLLVCRRLWRLTRQVDRKALTGVEPHTPFQPAE